MGFVPAEFETLVKLNDQPIPAEGSEGTDETVPSLVSHSAGWWLLLSLPWQLRLRGNPASEAKVWIAFNSPDKPLAGEISKVTPLDQPPPMTP